MRSAEACDRGAGVYCARRRAEPSPAPAGSCNRESPRELRRARRRERVIRIFPNGASVERLLGALLMEQHELWSTGYKYFDMAAYWDWRRPRAVAAD